MGKEGDYAHGLITGRADGLQEAAEIVLAEAAHAFKCGRRPLCDDLREIALRLRAEAEKTRQDAKAYVAIENDGAEDE